MATKLLSGERLRCLARPHWIVLARSLLPTPLPLVAGAALSVVLPLPAPPLLLLAAAISFGAAGTAYAAWGSRFVLVTDRRAVQQSGILSRRRSMVPLERIQDVTTARGPLGALLDYGDITVTTAGLRHSSLVLEHVRSPDRVAQFLFARDASGILDDHDGIPPAAGAARLHGRRQVHRRAPRGGAGGRPLPRPRPHDRA